MTKPQAPTKSQPSTRKRRRESGVALLLVLGILSLLTILAFSFAVSALSNRSSSQLSENLIRARLEAETGLQMAYRTMAIAFSNGADPANLFPATKTGEANHFGLTTAGADWDGRHYWASISSDASGLKRALHVLLAEVDFTPPPASDILSNTVGWLDIQDPEGDTSIVSRIVWMVIDESGKVDPSAAVDSVVGGTAEGGEVASRIGVSSAEINLKHVLDNDTMAESFQVTGLGNGTMPAGKRWFSYFHIFRLNPQSTASAANTDEVLEDVFPHSYDIEAFNAVSSDKHRFDLTGAGWDGFANNVAASGIDAAASDFWNGRTPAANSGGIPWFANIADNALRQQVIANLIDYSDSDSVATTDDAANPTYTGLETAPYINEIHLSAQVVDDGDSTYTLEVTMTPELVNIYSTALGQGGSLSVTLDIAIAELAAQQLTFTWSGLADVPATSYATLAGVPKTVDLAAVKKLKKFTAAASSASLVDSTAALWDFARTPTSPEVNLNLADPRMVSVEVDDPRHNLASDQWTWENGGWKSLSLGTLGAVNSACNPNPGGSTDLETNAVEPWSVSTAYIRNAAVKSLWELGAIHRGAAWQTLRLSVYNSSALPTTGLGDYSLGDANLLNQVKLAANTEVRGRVNLNTYSPKVLKGLLAGVTVGGTYAVPAGGGGAVITETQALALAGEPGVSVAAGQVLYENASTGGVGERPFRGRGQLALAVKLCDGTVMTQTTDAAQEEIVGKIVGLTTVRQNFFTILVKAQVVKDLPTGVKGGINGEFDPGIDRIMAQQRVKAILYRDAFTNRFRVERLEYLED